MLNVTWWFYERNSSTELILLLKQSIVRPERTKQKAANTLIPGIFIDDNERMNKTKSTRLINPLTSPALTINTLSVRLHLQPKTTQWANSPSAAMSAQLSAVYTLRFTGLSSLSCTSDTVEVLAVGSDISKRNQQMTLHHSHLFFFSHVIVFTLCSQHREATLKPHWSASSSWRPVTSYQVPQNNEADYCQWQTHDSQLEEQRPHVWTAGRWQKPGNEDQYHYL